MMLFKLSLRNIQKSYKDYAIYFFTIILGVSIFYIFNSLESQTIMLNLTETTKHSVSMLSTALAVISVFVSFVLGFLIIYANRFLMKRRNREFGIYMTLGMGKKTISTIILLETFVIGGISLLLGLVLGTALSQFMSIVVANLFEADMSKFQFVISYSAVLKTIIYFCIIFFIVMIFNVIQVNRCMLIDLIQGVKKSEQMKMKNPYICGVTFAISVVLLARAYYNVTAGAETLTTSFSIAKQMIYGAAGTVLVFWSLSGLIMKLIMSKEKVYYSKLNSFTFRQISSKVNTTVMSMSIICLMLFLAICVFSSSVSMNSSLKDGMKELATVDISISKQLNFSKTDEEGNEYSKEQIETSHYSIEESLETMGFSVEENLVNPVTVNVYKTDEVTLGDTLGMEDELFSGKEELVRISDYNSLARLYGLETFQLEKDQYMIICNIKNTSEMRNEGLSNHVSIMINGKSYSPKYTECKEGYLMMASDPQNFGIVLVPDNAVDETMITAEVLAADYKGNSKNEKQEIEDKVDELRHDRVNHGMLLSTKIDIYNDNIGTSAMAIFIGLYIGIVFLISSSAILALKELSESADSKKRYQTLRRIGLDESMINKSLFIQVGVFFTFPLILAMIHSIFGIQVCNIMLESFGRSGMLKSIILTTIFLVVIYGGYFLITFLCSKNIIREK